MKIIEGVVQFTNLDFTADTSTPSRFQPDRDSAGVRRMYLEFAKMALPQLSPKYALLTWHLCRGITSPLALTTPMGRWKKGVNSDLYTLRKRLGVQSQEQIVRMCWPLYALAWGKPLVGRFLKEESNE
jgi:hypothetical protein